MTGEKGPVHNISIHWEVNGRQLMWLLVSMTMIQWIQTDFKNVWALFSACTVTKVDMSSYNIHTHVKTNPEVHVLKQSLHPVSPQTVQISLSLRPEICHIYAAHTEVTVWNDCSHKTELKNWKYGNVQWVRIVTRWKVLFWLRYI